MGVHDLEKRHDSGTMTPPTTPTRLSHSKSDSASSDFLGALSSLRRGDSTSPGTGPRPAIVDLAKPGSTELITFPHHVMDYAFRTNAEGKKKKPIGEGLWSDVYLATPSVLKPRVQSSCTPFVPEMSPPLTPVHSRNSSLRLNATSNTPLLYAIKVPASTTAKKVLFAEARILSYLSRFPDADNHVVPFHGLDSRNGSLVLTAMDRTLETWIQTELNTLDEAARAQKLASIFPSIALSLLDSLRWLQDKDCIHADIKPSNILASLGLIRIPQLVYSDFSSTILTKPDVKIDSEASPQGAGTWDYLDPRILSSSSPAPVSASTDLWSLAITLLFLILGSSPYDAFKSNKFQQREMIKSGAPLQCMAYDDAGIVNAKRISRLSRDIGFDVQKWLAKVLVKDASRRASIAEWHDELLSAQY
jgi:serine/threonine protein kinase